MAANLKEAGHDAVVGVGGGDEGGGRRPRPDVVQRRVGVQKAEMVGVGFGVAISAGPEAADGEAVVAQHVDDRHHADDRN